VSKKNAVFLRCHLHLKRTFYQDRLGTNIGKTLQKKDRFVAAWINSR
jgi:hypothetical protein